MFVIGVSGLLTILKANGVPRPPSGRHFIEHCPAGASANNGRRPLPLQLADDDQLLISVVDTGIGLPAENVGRIFGAFFATKSQGTGLGLAITRSIGKSHGGRIRGDFQFQTWRNL